MDLKVPWESDSNSSVSLCWAKYKLNYHIYLNARWVFFHKFGAQICEVILNSHMKCWTAPRFTGLLWTGPWGKIMACIAKLSCKISALQRYYAALSGKSLPTLQDSPSVPSAIVKKSKRRERGCSTLKPSSFLGLTHHQIFWRSTMFPKPALFPFIGQEAPNVVDPLDWAVELQGTTETVTC
jgi:hypothetical protein